MENISCQVHQVNEFHSVPNKNTKLLLGYVIVFRARETACNIVALKARLLCVCQKDGG